MTNNPQPSPELFFETVNAHQRTAALKAAIELDLFSAIGKSKLTAAEIAAKLGTPERSTRILCDYLTILGFLTKSDGRYALTPDSALFLDRGSPAYLGGSLKFLHSPTLRDAFADLAETVRRGTTILDGQGSVSPENDVWVDFARSMAPLMMMPAQAIAGLISFDAGRPAKVLDIAAGHGMFGIVLAQKNASLEVVALDWPKVLDVAKENAARFGVSARHRTLPGDAFTTDFGTGYDTVLLTNFLHHFDIPTCETLLRKVAAALKPGGRAVTLEFVPNDDRVSPPGAAAFAMMMLGTTPKGDAYTFTEYQRMFGNAGFSRSEIHSLQPGMQSIVISHK
jgi:2-polyprenyl-3-methyl-5-hydroxy-6-metoxy-1,4-benzoquinol methylase